MTIHEIEFKPVHLCFIDVQEKQQEECEIMITQYSNWETVKAFSYIKDNKFLACYGIYPIFDHSCLVWSCFSKYIKDNCNYIGIIKSLKKLLQLAHDKGYSRIEAVVNTKHKEAEDFIKFLGFTKEGKMKLYFPNGQDAYLYSKVMVGDK